MNGKELEVKIIERQSKEELKSKKRVLESRIVFSLSSIKDGEKELKRAKKALKKKKKSHKKLLKMNIEDVKLLVQPSEITNWKLTGASSGILSGNSGTVTLTI